MHQILKQLIRPYTRLILPEISEPDLCFAISRFGIIRQLPDTAIPFDLTGDEQVARLGITELWLHPPRHYTSWRNFTGMVHMFSEGRFGLHIAEQNQITGEIHVDDEYTSWRMQGEHCCTFSLDTWALEARCELKS